MDAPRRHRPGTQARRQALLRATLEVAAERGTAGVTHRAVTERAGVPLATVSYFFPSIDALAAEALRTFAALRSAELLDLAAGAVEAGAGAEVLAATLAAASGVEPATALAQFEAYLHAARVAELRPAVAEAVAAFEEVAAVALAGAGVADPGPLVAAFVALADGFALRALALPGSVGPDDVAAAFRALFVGSVAVRG